MNFKVSQLKQLGPTEVSAEDFVYIIDINPTDGGVRSKKIAVGDLVDYRITNSALSGFVLLAGSYADPSFVASLDWGKILNTPTTISGYGITDAYTKTEVDTLLDTIEGNEVVSMSITGAETKTLNLNQADGGVVSVSYVDTYTHTQSSPASTWTVTHNMNKYPSVTIVDSAGTTVDGSVDFINLNSVTINFCGAFSGKAYFN
jgi:hypothetical protein